MYYHEFRAMNSDILLAASGDDHISIEAGFQLARAYVDQAEQRFTRFTEVSELAELNRSAGSWFQASPEMFEVLNQAYRLAIATHGLFNPAILPSLIHAGYDRSMDEIKGDLNRTGNSQAVETQDFRHVQLDAASRSIFLPSGMQIDLGGIAKGWIAQQAARQLANVSQSCAVSAGGDIFMVNLPEGENSWEVGLENPLDPTQDLAVLHVNPGAVATSSVVKRQWRFNGRKQHHLIDPRNGRPAETDWLSVTVWAEQAAEAEVYAKVLLIAGSQEAEEVFDHHSKAYLAVDLDGWVVGSQNYHEVFHV